MVENQSQLKSLRNTLLSLSAICFDQIFFDKVNAKAEIFKKDVYLPAFLFEEIKFKGMEIGWPISPKHIKPCIEFRDNLKWQNMYLYEEDHDAEDILNLGKSDSPIKHLSTGLNYFHAGMIEVFEKFAPTLESLEIRDYSRSVTHSKIVRNEKLVKFPNLKKLSVNVRVVNIHNLCCIDVTSFSESLESLELFDIKWTLNKEEYTKLNYFYELLKSAKNLKHLTINDLIYNLEDFTSIDFIQYFKNVRSLRLNRLIGVHLSDKFMAILMSNLSKLENLSLTWSNINNNPIDFHDELENVVEGSHFKKEINFLNNKHLKYLGLDKCAYGFPQIVNYATEIGTDIDAESFLNFFEKTYSDHMYNNHFARKFFKYFNENSHIITTQQWRRMEKIISGRMVQRSQMHFTLATTEMSRLIEKADNEWIWSEDFLTVLANFIVNSKNRIAYKQPNFYKKQGFYHLIFWVMKLIQSNQLKNFMLSYALANPKSKLAAMYMEHLLISDFFHVATISTFGYIEQIGTSLPHMDLCPIIREFQKSAFFDATVSLITIR